MAKAMLFIDGTWLYHNQLRLRDRFQKDAKAGEDFKLDYEKLPKVLAEAAQKKLNISGEIDLSRKFLFGSYKFVEKVNEEETKRQKFFMLMRDRLNYELELYKLEQRLENGSIIEQKEKCVDVALAASMLYYASLPNAYDVAIAVLGDRDFVPALRKTRMLGKRVVVASIKGSCHKEIMCYPAGIEATKVKDEIVWFDDLLSKLRYIEEPISENKPKPERVSGVIIKKNGMERCGLIEVEDKTRYLFNEEDLVGMNFDFPYDGEISENLRTELAPSFGPLFSYVREGERVIFEIEEKPSEGFPGKATKVAPSFGLEIV